MTEPAGDRRITDLMVELGLAGPDEAVTTRPLTGGVSSDIALVETAAGQFCVKFALARLKVAADWQVPVNRNAAEYDWLSYAAALDPTSVPRLHGQSKRLGGFAMAYLPAATHPNWKTEMLAGRIAPGFAARLGTTLARIHAASAGDPAIARRFAHQDNFHALRLEPYLIHTATRHPALAPRLTALADSVHNARIALVHGDISPKNILIGPAGPVILDAECASFGDPAFDLAFCLNHLVIKSLVPVADPATLAAESRALWAAYAPGITWEDRAACESRVAALLPALMLARVDGKSPVEYLDPAGQARLRTLALALLADPPDRLDPIIAKAAGQSA